jgi:hypothetical protein
MIYPSKCYLRTVFILRINEQQINVLPWTVFQCSVWVLSIIMLRIWRFLTIYCAKNTKSNVDGHKIIPFPSSNTIEWTSPGPEDVLFSFLEFSVQWNITSDTSSPVFGAHTYKFSIQWNNSSDASSHVFIHIHLQCRFLSDTIIIQVQPTCRHIRTSCSIALSFTSCHYEEFKTNVTEFLLLPLLNQTDNKIGQHNIPD